MDVRLEARDEGGRSWPVLVWRFAGPSRTCATGPHGGGLGVRHWAINAQVATGYADADPDAHCAAIAAACGLEGDGVGLLTAANVGEFACADDGGAGVVATVGLGYPEWAAEPAGAQSAAAAPSAGTINVFAWVPEPLADAALVNAVATITEAKVQALLDAGVAASGTATDAVVVACPLAGGGDVHSYGGPRSRWGAPLARAAHEAIVAGARAWTSHERS